MIADPHCTNCGRRKVWIGISGSAEACCPVCPDGGPTCVCGSTHTAEFRLTDADGYEVTDYPGRPKYWSCHTCGRIWTGP